MAVNTDIGNHLNEQQIFMLHFLKEPLPEKDFLEMRRLAVKLLAKKLDDTIDRWEQEKDIKPEDYAKMSKGHFR